MANWKKVIVSGSTANLASLQVDDLTSGQVVIGGGASALTTTAINGTGNIVGTTGATGLSHSGSFSGSFQGDGTNLTGVTATAVFPTIALTDLATADKFFVNDGANKYITYGNLLTDLAGTNLVVEGTDSLALADTISGNKTFSANVNISGDLTVNGTASFQNTENLLVADRFVLFASGSVSTGDGGIVVQQDTQNIGEAFAWDSGTSRWGVTGSFDASTSAYTPEAFMSTVIEGAASDPTAVVAKLTKKGNIFVASDESIYIYS